MILIFSTAVITIRVLRKIMQIHLNQKKMFFVKPVTPNHPSPIPHHTETLPKPPLPSPLSPLPPTHTNTRNAD